MAAKDRNVLALASKKLRASQIAESNPWNASKAPMGLCHGRKRSAIRSTSSCEAGSHGTTLGRYAMTPPIASAVTSAAARRSSVFSVIRSVSSECSGGDGAYPDRLPCSTQWCQLVHCWLGL